MPEIIEPRTERLQLRQWREDDRPAFAAMCADPEVIEFFPKTLSKSESDAAADRCEALIAERGWGFWAAQSLETGRFLGFVGLHIPSPDLPFSPCVEIGWRLARPYYSFVVKNCRHILTFTPESGRSYFCDLRFSEEQGICEVELTERLPSSGSHNKVDARRREYVMPAAQSGSFCALSH